MKVSKNTVVSVGYQLFVGDEGEKEELMEQTKKSQPYKFTCGAGTELEKFEENLMGKEVGEAFDFYIGEFRKFGFTTAGALDTNCIDKESSLPFFIAAVRLYEALKEQRYLDDAVALGYYISTWLWHYDGIYPEDDSFTKYGFHTFGGTSISTQHQALDTFGLLPVPEMRKLAELTGDKQWAEKSEAMWRFCCQLISDGTLVMNGRKRPAGGQCEAFFQNSWKLYSNKGRFDNWLVAWPNALRLEFLRKGKI